MDVEPTNQQLLSDRVLSLWNKIFVESEIKQVQQEKVCQIRHLQDVPSNVKNE